MLYDNFRTNYFMIPACRHVRKPFTLRLDGSEDWWIANIEGYQLENLEYLHKYRGAESSRMGYGLYRFRCDSVVSNSSPSTCSYSGYEHIPK